MGWNRIEGRESKAFKMGSPAGLWGGCLKKGGPGTPLRTIAKGTSLVE